MDINNNITETNNSTEKENLTMDEIFDAVDTKVEKQSKVEETSAEQVATTDNIRETEEITDINKDNHEEVNSEEHEESELTPDNNDFNSVIAEEDNSAESIVEETSAEQPLDTEDMCGTAESEDINTESTEEGNMEENVVDTIASDNTGTDKDKKDKKDDKPKVPRNPAVQFVVLAEQRTSKVLESIDSLGKLASKKNYVFTIEQVDKMFTAIQEQAEEVKQNFIDILNDKKVKKKGFTF